MANRPMGRLLLEELCQYLTVSLLCPLLNPIKWVPGLSQTLIPERYALVLAFQVSKAPASTTIADPDAY